MHDGVLNTTGEDASQREDANGQVTRLKREADVQRTDRTAPFPAVSYPSLCPSFGQINASSTGLVTIFLTADETSQMPVVVQEFSAVQVVNRIQNAPTGASAPAHRNTSCASTSPSILDLHVD